MTVNVLTAFVGGLITILAPCAALLIPAFFAYAFSSRSTLLSRTLLFFIGLLVALVPLGVAAGGLGSLLVAHRETITTVAGVAIVILGIIQALALRFPHVHLPWAQPTGAASSSPVAVFLLGVGYGLAGAGCTGPILGAVLLMSAQSSSVAAGAAMMAAYSVGMFAPVAILAWAWDALDVSGRRWLRPHPVRFLGRDTTVGNLVSGALCVVLGIVLVVTGGSTGLGIVDASGQQRIESRLMRQLSGLPPLVIVLVVVALVALVCLAIVVSRGRHAERSEHPATDADSEDVAAVG